MARLTFPDEGSRSAFRTAPSGRPLTSAAGAAALVYLDSGATTLADIQTTAGAAIAGSSLNLDAYSRFPLFLGPADGTDTLYVVVDGGPVSPMYARVDDRLDAVKATADAAETPAGAAAKVSAEATTRAAADSAEATARAAAVTAAQAAAVQRSNHTGTQLAATVSDFSTAVVTAASGAYAPLGPALLGGGRPWGFLGDSITFGSLGAAGRGFVDMTPWMVGTAFVAPVAPASPVTGAAYSTNAGVPGEKSVDILARAPALIASGIKGMVLLAGTNDAGNAVSVAAYLTNMTAIATLCRKAGIPLVVGTVPPRGATASTAIKTLTAAYNLALRPWAANLGVYLADVYGALVDISSGLIAAAYNNDDVHPNTAGHRRIAEAMAPAMRRAIQTQPSIVAGKSIVSLVGNPMFDTNATGWFEQPGGTGTAPAYSFVTDITGRLPVGARWREMDFDATASGGVRTYATALGSAWSVGDTLLVSAQLDVIDVSGYFTGANADPVTAGMNLRLVDQSGVALPKQNTSPSLGEAPGEIGVVAQVPAGTTGVNLWLVCTLPTGAHARFRISAADVRNLTTLAVTGF